MNLIEKLNWRYATKRMNGQEVPAEKLQTILDVIQLSPSSLGLQPYTVFVIENEEMRKKLQPAAYNQPQIIESSHLLVFAAWDNVSQEIVDDYMQNIAETRGVTTESLTGFRNNFARIVSASPEENFNWAARQAYIALGFGLVAAANEAVDATPMEGFNNAAFDEILGLKEKGLKSVVLLALGYRNAEVDFLAQAKKVRHKKDKLFIEI